MNSLMQFLSNIPNLLLVLLGFSFVVFVHELGHFLAARWAGIRVLAFAIGFGPAIVSFRKGLGVRLGSTEAQRDQAQLDAVGRAGEAREHARELLARTSPTEYRLNALPFGGYVKMLGQVDGDPSAVSDARDSYQNCAPWKRMVVISAGVIANIILSLVLFVMIYTVGLPASPPVLGYVVPGSPASKAQVHSPTGALLPGGLVTGDRVLTVDGDDILTFTGLIPVVAMAEKGQPLTFRVQRENVGTLTALVTPEMNRVSHLLDIGVAPALSGRVVRAATPQDTELLKAEFAKVGLQGLEPGMALTEVGGAPAASAATLREAIGASGGRPVTATFALADSRATVTITPRASLQVELVPKDSPVQVALPHVLGLTPVMSVAGTTPAAEEQGLRKGDLFAVVGGVEYPNAAQGIAAIQAQKGGTIDLVVLRRGDAGSVSEVKLTGVKVNSKGQIGFQPGDWSDSTTAVAMPPQSLLSSRGARGGTGEYAPAAVGFITSPGTRVIRVGTTPVRNFTQLREALRAQTLEAYTTWNRPGITDPSKLSVDVGVTIQRPVRGILDDAATQEPAVWTLHYHDVCELHQLGWEAPFDLEDLFSPEEFTLQGADPLDSIRLGLRETHRVMTSTYLTFVRLAEGSVKVEHLKGPVGIAHLGTQVASQGFIMLVFFIALISVNLAVINFLPIPFVDGGQFLFILYEQFRGRPPSIMFQNVATMAGLALIVSVFLIVTFNDIRNLLGL